MSLVLCPNPQIAMCQCMRYLESQDHYPSVRHRIEWITVAGSLRLLSLSGQECHLLGFHIPIVDKNCLLLVSKAPGQFLLILSQNEG